MLPVSDRVAQLYSMDSIRKSLEVYVYEWVEDWEWMEGGYYALLAPNSTSLANTIAPTFSDESIVSESMDFKEGLLEGEELKFGSVVTKELSFQRIYNGISYAKKFCRCVLAIYEEDGVTVANRITLMYGQFTVDKFQDNGFIKDVTIRSCLADILAWNIGSDDDGHLTAFLEPGPSAYSFDGSTIGDYLDFVGMAAGIWVNVPWDSTERRLKFPSVTGRYNSVLDTPVAMSAASTPLTAGAALSGLAEICGAFLREAKMVVVDEYPSEQLPYAVDVYSDWLYMYPTASVDLIRADTRIRRMFPADDLFPANQVYPLYSGSLLNGAFNTGTFVIPQLINATWAEEDLVNFTRVEAYLGDNIAAAKGSSGSAVYIVKDNAALSKDVTGGYYAFQEACASILSMCDSNNYPLGTLEHLWAPFVEPGDNIVIIHESEAIIFPVFGVQVHGINLLRATTECRATAK